MIIIVLFLVGLFFGSFFNVVIDRLPRGEDFFVGRSHCDFCKHTLAWYDLVPFFSFVLLHGNCRYCHTFMGWKYPIIEITTGLVYVLSYLFLSSLSLLFFAVTIGIMSCLVIIFYIDLFSGIIPDGILLILFVFTILRLMLLSGTVVVYIISMVATGLFFLSIFFLTKMKGIGFGDVKYAFVMGLLLGFPHIIIGLYIAFLTGALVALILVIAKKKSFAGAIAFGPFLVLGTSISLFFGSNLWVLFARIIGI